MLSLLTMTLETLRILETSPPIRLLVGPCIFGSMVPAVADAADIGLKIQPVRPSKATLRELQGGGS